MNLKEPVKVKQSNLYSVVLEDADGINHFWLPNGKYDGHCRPYKNENADSKTG